MKVSKEQSNQNRIKLIEVASRLFKLHGFDGVGVADIGKAAGLTHGALYAHFKSKDELIAAVCLHSQSTSLDLFLEQMRTGGDPLNALIDLYVSGENGQLTPGSCAMPVYTGEIGRQQEAAQQNYAQGFARIVKVVEESMPSTWSTQEARRKAVVLVVSMVGAVSMARATAKTCPAVSAEILESARAELKAIVGGRR
ncbi:TetR family transcriptional regulator [Paraburkholderia sp. C35]|uniref:TetR/AcrR family transcriptional regulator n=1 Tax=Paraburkholderia sp. C35 TaxID=2126993 RepID=UPI0013A5877A|nr:TetR family transcriptional regulator [Paraburkholderia sp. C35]